jgi:hypothetical protein
MILERIPFVEPFISIDPLFVQEVTKAVEIKAFSPYSIVYDNGVEGIYYVQQGMIAVEGRIYG